MKTRRKVVRPADFAQALKQDAAALQAFDAMPPSHQARYVAWINQAKKPETRAHRTAKSLAMMKQWLASKS